MIAQDIMTRNIYTISPEASVQEVAQLLSRERISGAPVVDKDGKLLGIVTQADIIWNVGRDGQRAADIMNPEIIAVDEKTPVGEIAILMSKRHIKRVPVMCDGKMVGIISRADIVQAVAQGYLVVRPW